jgi:heptosyltransferase-2
MKVVVIRFSSLGDCTLLCPFLEHLKRCGASEVAIVTKRAYAELFAAAPAVDRIYAVDERAGWHGLAGLIGSLRRQGCVIVDAHNSIRSHVVAGALGGPAARLRKYYGRRLGLILLKRKTRIPTVRGRYSALGEALGFPASEVSTGGIDVPERAMRHVSDMLAGSGSRWVTMAPGSRWPMKRWAADNFAELARRISKRHDCGVILLGDRADQAVSQRVASALGRRVIDLTGRTRIMEAAAAMRQSIAFVGNDSGLMHLAEAVGTPVVALFGPTVEEFGYYPSLPSSKVIERGISCRPCSRNGSRPCPKGTQECLRDIPIEPVAEAFDDLVENRGPARRILN